MNLSNIPIIDHHAHPLLKPAATRDAVGFRQWFTESTDPEIHTRHVPHTLFFRTALRWLAEMLECEPSLEAVLTARAAQSAETWTRRLFAEANIDILLCDYGYGGTDSYTHTELQTLLPCRIEPILRLETLAQALIEQHDTFAQMLDAFMATVSQARANGYVALKSIIAYRSGLAVESVSRDEAADAFGSLKAQARPTEPIHLDNKLLCDFLIWSVLEVAEAQHMPIQFHTGFGDSDADLCEANPLHLRPLIEDARCPLVLLHAGWPFYREAAHLAAIYPNVWLDLSLAIPFATTGIPTMLGDILGMAPFSKVMFATDAFTMPEIFWLAARWGRWGLGRVLDEFIAESFLSPDEAWAAAEAILGDNARRLYNL
jgi:predicted TIM-barrel fold metal-dependent hydrolase